MKNTSSQIALLIICFLLFFKTSNAQFTNLIAKNEKAVFQILSYDEHGVCHASGTGFFIDSIGTGISALHVLKNAKLVVIKRIDGKVFPIRKITGVCEECDMIEFSVDQKSPYKYFINPTNFLPKKGAQLFIIGDPEGYHHTVTTGILSAVRDDDGVKTIQTTASISQGSSGSPLMNMSGQVIGVVSYSDSRGEDLNFAYSIDCKKKMERDNLLDISKYYKKDIRFINRYFPEEPFLILHSIEFTDSSTVLNLSYANMSISFGDGAFIYSVVGDTTRSMYLKDKITGTKYFMTSSTIGESPEKATTLDLGETVFFKMNFPRLNNVTELEIGEGMSGGNWSFNNIQIPNKQQFTVESIEKFSKEKHEELFSHLHNEYYEEAIKEIKKITKKGKNDFRARVAAAVIDYSLNNIDSAIANLKLALKLNPNNEDVHADLYKLYFDQDKPELALQEINRAIELNDDYIEYYSMRAQVLYNMNKWEDALKDINKYLSSERKPDSEIYYYSGMCKIKLNDDTACSDFEKAKLLSESKKELDKILVEIERFCKKDENKK